MPKQALSYVRSGYGVQGGKIWEWSNLRLEWVLLYDIKPGTDYRKLVWEKVSGNLGE